MSKTKKVEVSKIALQIGKKKIELSLDEARELQQILTDLLGLETERKCNRITIIPAPPVVVVPYPCPAPRPRRYDWWEVKPIWIGGNDSTGTADTSITFVSMIDDNADMGPSPDPISFAVASGLPFDNVISE